ncbi:MAG: hypothetical protein IPN20_17300 [Haliscomenobacter sp.]|nr:hypothetical protein [Haliscomenobacter sp.]
MSKTKLPIIDPEKIHFLNIQLNKGSIDSSDSFIAKPLKPTRINFTFRHIFHFQFNEKRCLVRLQIHFFGLDNGGKPVGLSATYHLDFLLLLENMEHYLAGKEPDIRVSKILGATLLGLCISTARGIILERTFGTPFQGTILPVVDPMKLLTPSENHEVLWDAAESDKMVPS